MSYAQAVKKLKEIEEQKIAHQQTSNTPSVFKETVTPLMPTAGGGTERKPSTNNLTVLKKQPSLKNMETQTEEQSSESKKTSRCSKEMNEVLENY